MTYCPLTDGECRDDCEWAVPISDPDVEGKDCAARYAAEELRVLTRTLEETAEVLAFLTETLERT